MKNAIAKLRTKVEQTNPLVHNITNYVTVNDCANVLLALGASPVMADEICEVEEMVSKSSALVLNIGTLQENIINSMILAGKRANSLNIPVILDPVGIGATMFRKEAIKAILNNVQVAVIKGNLSEIAVLAGADVQSKGVDSCKNTKLDSIEIAKKVANTYKCIVGITAATDIVTDGAKYIEIKNGTPIMEKVSGTGCMIASLAGAFCAVTDDYYLATVSAIATMSVAGEIALDSFKNNGTASYKIGIIDAISKMNEKSFAFISHCVDCC